MENFEIMFFVAVAVIVILLLLLVFFVCCLIRKKNFQNKYDSDKQFLVLEENKCLDESSLWANKSGSDDCSTFQKTDKENQLKDSKLSISKDELFFIKKCQEILNSEQNYWSHEEYERLHQTICCRLDDIRCREAAKNKIKVECFELLKYTETFNVLCEMVLKNPDLLKLFHKESEEKCLNILQRIICFSDEQVKTKKTLLSEVIHIVKSAEINKQ